MIIPTEHSVTHNKMDKKMYVYLASYSLHVRVNKHPNYCSCVCSYTMHMLNVCNEILYSNKITTAASLYHQLYQQVLQHF